MRTAQHVPLLRVLITTQYLLLERASKHNLPRMCAQKKNCLGNNADHDAMVDHMENGSKHVQVTMNLEAHEL